MMAINPKVFESAVNAENLKAETLEASETFETYLDALFKAANSTYDDSNKDAFQLKSGEPNNDDDLTGTIRTLGIIHQTSEKMPQYFDLDFAVTLNNKNFQYMGMATLSPRVMKEMEGNVATFAKAASPIASTPLDRIQDMNHQVFHWILNNLPKEQRELFLEACEEMGLADKPVFGFATTANDDEPNVPQS